MSTTLTVNGVAFAYPDTGDQNWGGPASAWAAAVTSGMLQKAGGTFTLTADAKFGNSFGLFAKYFTSMSTNPASVGVLRLANADVISFRNNANNADLSLSVNGSDQLVFNGSTLTQLITAVGDTSTVHLDVTTGTLTANIPNAAITTTQISASAGILYSQLSLTGGIVNADINASAAIAYSKLALTGSILNADLAGSIAASKLIGTDIATVGTVTTGTWNATTIAIAHGGTGQTSANPAFNALSPLTTKGDLIGFSTVNARLAVGSDGTVLTADSAQATGLKWGTVLTNPMTTAADMIIGGVSGAPARLAAGANQKILKMDSGTPTWDWALSSVTSQSTTYNILSTDNVVLLSAGSAFTATLPTAASVAGQMVYLKKTDSSFNLVTIATTSSQTIDGALTTALSTQNECLFVVSDGSNWQILSRRIASDTTSYTPSFGGGFGTVTGISARWTRDFDYVYVSGSATAGTTASALYSISLPTGLSIDTTKNPLANATGAVGPNIGFWTASATTGGNGSIVTATSTDATKVYFGGGTGGAATNTPFSGSGLIANSAVVSFWFRVPIANWNG